MGRRKIHSSQSLLQRNAFQRFRQVFQRQRRRGQSRLILTRHSLCATMYQPLATLVLFASAVFRIAEACSSRSTPKPRPPSQNTRPNVTFPTFECPINYQSVYCLNGARCFTVKIENDVIYSCECTEGFTGPRCEYKDLEGSYLPSREKVMIETASIAGGVTVAVLLIVIISIAIYVYVSRRRKPSDEGENNERWLAFAPSKSSESYRMDDLHRSSDVELGGRASHHHQQQQHPFSVSAASSLLPDPLLSSLPTTTITTTSLSLSPPTAVAVTSSLNPTRSHRTSPP